MASFPRAIVILINKVPDKTTLSKIKTLGENGKEILKQNSKFDSFDIEKVERLC